MRITCTSVIDFVDKVLSNPQFKHHFTDVWLSCNCFWDLFLHVNQVTTKTSKISFMRKLNIVIDSKSSAIHSKELYNMTSKVRK